MGGLAAIAKAAGHKVTGADKAVYPPMSDQLAAQGITVTEGFNPQQLDAKPDLVVVGNVMSRGMPIVEELLNRGMAYCSGPQWLAEQVLKDRWVIAVSGTHGKTTTASLVAWILESCGHEPGFLIGGVPGNFDCSARLGSTPFFVIEADEYDTAFFDKRAKFLHYDPRTLVINNLEYDHADIYQDIDAILWQFHQMLRILPGNGRLIVNADDANIARLIKMGCWTPVETFASENTGADWRAERSADDGLTVVSGKKPVGQSDFSLSGQHNLENALAAILACRHAGVPIESALKAVAGFNGVKRRLEHLGTFGGVSLYDDFAHHPTAIERTLRGLQGQPGSGRVMAVLEPRSNSMKLGAHCASLPDALRPADHAWVYRSDDIQWSLDDTLKGMDSVSILDSVDSIVADVVAAGRAGDAIVVMSNGDFQGIHARLRDALQHKASSGV